MISARENPAAVAGKALSDLIIEAAPHVEDFLGHLFQVEPELSRLQYKHAELAPLYSVKRKFVQRKALTGYTEERASEVDGFAIRSELEALFQEPFHRIQLRLSRESLARKRGAKLLSTATRCPPMPAWAVAFAARQGFAWDRRSL